MNPSVPEEAGQTARTMINALGANPLVLVVLMINIVFIAFLWFTIRELATRKDSMIADMIHLLAACPAAVAIPPKD